MVENGLYIWLILGIFFLVCVVSFLVSKRKEQRKTEENGIIAKREFEEGLAKSSEDQIDEEASEPVRFERPDDYLRDRDSRYMDIFISGLSHHCTKKDIGYFAGTIFNEASNPYNSKAMAIGDQNTKRIVGYVPEKILTEYRQWCKGKTCSCAGIIFEEDGMLRGRARAYLSDKCSEAAILHNVQDYIFTACDRFGWKKPNITS